MRKFPSALRIFAIAGFAIVALVPCGDVGAAFAVATFASVPRLPSDGRASRTTPTLVVFGDSLARGFRASPGHGWMDLLHDRLERIDPNAAIDNQAVDGSRVIDLREQVADGPAPGAARAVLIVAGGNDLMYGTDPYSLARADIALLRDVRRRYPGARVIVANIPDISWRSFHLKRSGPAQPLPAPYRFGLRLLTSVENAIVDRIARRCGADILDLHRLTLDGDAQMPGLATISLREFAERYVSSDGLHPNDRGYALLADFAWPHVARAMRVHP